jgi:subtilisin family serine protease
MAHLDFRLRHVQQGAAPADARVLLWFSGDLAALAAVGFRVSSVAGDVAAGSVPSDRLEELREHPQVLLVEGSRPLKDETDTSLPAINLLDPETMLRTVPGYGRGSIIGVIDSSFDLTHPCFRDGKKVATRILCAWDQVNLRLDGGPPPASFDYGVEYTQARIDRLAAAEKVVVIESREQAGGHGTYVAGVAAGNGARQLIFKGVAPEADLIFVAYRNDVPVGGSAYVLDAICYIVERARDAGRPAVINLSQGDGLGAHDGTSLLERAIDHLVSHERVLVVNSAGNEGTGEHHARGRVAEGGTSALPFELGAPPDGDTIDLWYGGDDRFGVALKTPRGEESSYVRPGEEKEIVFDSGAKAMIYSDTNYPGNGENRISVVLMKGDDREIGTWQLLLLGEHVRRGDFDAWADLAGGVTSILFAQAEPASTVTIPGTARRIVTVGGFVSRVIEYTPGGGVRGALSEGSSLGPTRDGRHKPDLTAPSHLIMAPRSRQTPSALVIYDPQRGTSFAAPHVAGVAALLWALRPGLSAECLREVLLSGAADDCSTGATPNHNWGHGKLDARASYVALNTGAEGGVKHRS